MSQLALVDILGLIPHRDPFLFISQAQVISETEIEGVACWSATHPIFKGHFPGQPIVPGVVQVEACAQLAGVLMSFNNPQALAEHNKLGVLGAIRQAKFKNILLPASTLQITCQIRRISTNFFLAKAKGSTANQLILNCELVIVLKSLVI